jgi:hypothetical protein
MPKGKEAADLGLETLGQAAADPELMKMLFEDMNNPEMLAEAEKLMKDKVRDTYPLLYLGMRMTLDTHGFFWVLPIALAGIQKEDG